MDGPKKKMDGPKKKKYPAGSRGDRAWSRRADYGTPLQNHTRTAAMWNQFLSQKYPGINLTAEDICFMMILTKISRCATTGKITRDSLIDCAGYAANVELIWDERAGTDTETAPIDLNIAAGPG